MYCIVQGKPLGKEMFMFPLVLLYSTLYIIYMYRVGGWGWGRGENICMYTVQYIIEEGFIKKPGKTIVVACWGKMAAHMLL